MNCVIYIHLIAQKFSTANGKTPKKGLNSDEAGPKE